MIGVCVGLGVASILFAMWAGVVIDRLIRDRDAAREDQHLDCLAVCASAVSDAHAAYVLRQAAKDYDSPAGQRRLKVIQQGSTYGESPSIPARWLLQQADDYTAPDFGVHQ